MANKPTTYWPHLILGFLFLAISLSVWTVKSTAQMPVQEDNSFIQKYQQTDIHINKIEAQKAAFDAKYTIVLKNKETMRVPINAHSRVAKAEAVALSKGNNSFTYEIQSKDGTHIEVDEATFLLTRPHTRVDDKLIEGVEAQGNLYPVQNVAVEKAGRYTLVLKVKAGNMLGYSETPAYLNP